MPPVRLVIVQDTHRFEGEDGHVFWAVGAAPAYEDSDGEPHFIGFGGELADPRAFYCQVAGIAHYPDALTSAAFAPGERVALRLEPENAYDPDAVSVWASGSRTQAGYVPREFSGLIARRLRGGEKLEGFVLREIRRGSKKGPRAGLHIIIAPPGEVQLMVIEQ